LRQREVYDAIRTLDETGEPAVLATIVKVVGSSPGELGAKMVIDANGRSWGTVGGGCIDGMVFTEARRVIEEDRPRTIVVDLTENEDPDHGLICGGRVEVFLEPLFSPTLYICGAGHIGAALARIMAPLDWKVVVLDDRARFASAERFPSAERIVAGFDDTLGKLRARRGAFIAVVTRGHKFDQQCLEWALRQDDARYVGLVGSKVKITKILHRAREAGYPAEKIARIRAPIGLDVGSITVEEIAVAIAAEMIAVRRRGPDASRELLNPGSTWERPKTRASDIPVPPKHEIPTVESDD
jgi:xanthine dehydrogenase accessory factor